MKRFYFDSCDGGSFIQDDQGLELVGIESARDQAVAGLADLARELIPLKAGRELVIEVRDDAGQGVLRAMLSIRVEMLD